MMQLGLSAWRAQWAKGRQSAVHGAPSCAPLQGAIAARSALQAARRDLSGRPLISESNAWPAWALAQDSGAQQAQHRWPLEEQGMHDGADAHDHNGGNSTGGLSLQLSRHMPSISDQSRDVGQPRSRRSQMRNFGRSMSNPMDPVMVTGPGKSRLLATKHPHHHTTRHADNPALEGLASSLLHSSSGVWAVSRAAAQQSQRDQAAQAAHRQRQDSQQAAANAEDAHIMIGQAAKANKFDQAIALVQQLARDGDVTALSRLSHKYFMRYTTQHRVPQHAVALVRALPLPLHTPQLYTLAMGVCAECGDLAMGNALLELALANTLPVDVKLCTNFMRVCKAAGAVDRAYAVYLDMKRQRLPVDAQAVGVLVSVFADVLDPARVGSASPGATTASSSASAGGGSHTDASVLAASKDRLVLYERAVSVMKDAEASGIKLSVVCWNTLMVCASRCGQLKRTYEMLDEMRAGGLQPDSYTYVALMEASMQGSRPDMALRLFGQAMREGHTSQVELYTLALTACREGATQRLSTADMWEQATSVYSIMQRHGVQPDTRLFSAFVTVAGTTGRLEHAFELLQEVQAEGLPLNAALCSAFIYACCKQGQFRLAHRIYMLCASQGVYPELPQYNQLMDWSASQRRFGDVVSLLTDMTRCAGLAPNLNTYRVLLNACQLADQAALAFEVFAVMKLNKVHINNKRFAASMYFTLLKCCQNMLRHAWAEHLPQPAPWAHAPTTLLPSALSAYKKPQQQQHVPQHQQPVVRLAEAKQVLLALGSSLEARGANSLLAQQPSASTWVQYAIVTYRDMLSRGFRPPIDMLEKLMACLRIPGSVALQHALATGTRLGNPPATPKTPGAAAATAAAGMKVGTPGMPGSAGVTLVRTPQQQVQMLADLTMEGAGRASASDNSLQLSVLAWAGSPLKGGLMASSRVSNGVEEQLELANKYQVVFDRRALALLEDAMARGLLPSFNIEQPCTVDLTHTPPTLAEVYTLAVLQALERKAERARACAGAKGGASGTLRLFFHAVTLLVPPFDPNLVLWPSYVPKMGAMVGGKQAEGYKQQQQQPAAEAPAMGRAGAAPGRREVLVQGGMAQLSALASDDEDDHPQYGQDEELQQQLRALGVIPSASPRLGDLGEPEGRGVHMKEEEDEGDEEAGEGVGRLLERSVAAERQAQARRAAEESGAAAGTGAGSGVGVQGPRGSSTGLAVAATLRRLKLFAHMDAQEGAITLEPQQIIQWVRAKRTFEMRLSGQLLLAGAPRGVVSSGAIHGSSSAGGNSHVPAGGAGRGSAQHTAPTSNPWLQPQPQQQALQQRLPPHHVQHADGASSMHHGPPKLWVPPAHLPSHAVGAQGPRQPLEQPAAHQPHDAQHEQAEGLLPAGGALRQAAGGSAAHADVMRGGNPAQQQRLIRLGMMGPSAGTGVPSRGLPQDGSGATAH